MLFACLFSNEMKQIADGPNTSYSFIVLLIQKQFINFLDSNIYINYLFAVQPVSKKQLVRIREQE